MSGGFHLLVPVKRLAIGKSRLAATLSPVERADLILAMLDNVLSAASKASEVKAVSVVTADPRIRRRARGAGLGVIGDAAGSLNGALGAAVAGLADDAIAIVHADLPWLRAEAVDRLLAVVGGHGFAIAADQHGKGTSAMAWRGPVPPRLAFGAGSLPAHLDGAKASGLPCRAILSDPAFHDLDIPADRAPPRHFPPAAGIAA